MVIHPFKLLVNQVDKNQSCIYQCCNRPNIIILLCWIHYLAVEYNLNIKIPTTARNPLPLCMLAKNQPFSLPPLFGSVSQPAAPATSSHPNFPIQGDPRSDILYSRSVFCGILRSRNYFWYTLLLNRPVAFPPSTTLPSASAATHFCADLEKSRQICRSTECMGLKFKQRKLTL